MTTNPPIMIETDRSGTSWKLEITVDKACIDCIVGNEADDDGLGGVLINRSDKMIRIYNYVVISYDECAAAGNHV